MLEDFLQQFTGGAANTDQNAAARYHDRFVSKEANDRDFDNQAYQESAAEHLQQLPDDQFDQAARNAAAQTPPAERAGVLESLLGALSAGGGGLPGGANMGAAGGGIGALAGLLGLGSTDPRRMDENDFTKVMNYARKERPDALRQTVQEKPWFVKAMGNPVVMGALTMAATRLLSNRRR